MSGAESEEPVWVHELVKNISNVPGIIVNQARHSDILSWRLKLEKLHVFVSWLKHRQCLTSEVLCYFAAHIFFICIKIDPPDDQNQDIFFLALNSQFSMYRQFFQYCK